MKDDAYSLELLPATLKRLTFTAANAIEENLQYLILLFPYFSGKIRASPIGSYGYLELTETGLRRGRVRHRIRDPDQQDQDHGLRRGSECLDLPRGRLVHGKQRPRVFGTGLYLK